VTLLEMTGAAPYFTIHNSTTENGDNGRECRIYARGHKSDSTEHVLGLLEFSHEGTGDDQKALFRVQLNDGDDDLVPGIEPLKCLSDNTVVVQSLTASRVVFSDANKALSTPAATDVTAAELEELSDGSTTTLHNHAAAGFTSRCKVKIASDQSIAGDGTWTKLNFDDDSSGECYDNGNEYNTTTKRFVASAAGLYHITVIIVVETPGTANPVEAQINVSGGSSLLTANAMGTATVPYNRLVVSGDYYMASSAYVEVYFHLYGGVAKSVKAADSRLMIHRIS